MSPVWDDIPKGAVRTSELVWTLSGYQVRAAWRLPPETIAETDLRNRGYEPEADMPQAKCQSCGGIVAHRCWTQAPRDFGHQLRWIDETDRVYAVPVYHEKAVGTVCDGLARRLPNRRRP